MTSPRAGSRLERMPPGQDPPGLIPRTPTGPPPQLHNRCLWCQRTLRPPTAPPRRSIELPLPLHSHTSPTPNSNLPVLPPPPSIGSICATYHPRPLDCPGVGAAGGTHLTAAERRETRCTCNITPLPLFHCTLNAFVTTPVPVSPLVSTRPWAKSPLSCMCKWPYVQHRRQH
jgi:hypothetical protein